MLIPSTAPNHKKRDKIRFFQFVSVKKSVEIPLQDIGSNNKLLKRATGKDPGIDRKMRGGWDVSNNVRTNKI